MRIGLIVSLLLIHLLSYGQNYQWDKRYGGSGNDVFKFLQQTTDGGYVLGGFSTSGISGDRTEKNQGVEDYWIVKIDTDGTKQWDKLFGGSSEDYLWSLQQTTDGGYILGGWSSSGKSGDKTEISRGSYDYWIVKTDANGNKQWDKSFGGNQDDRMGTVQQTTDGGYILGGESMSGISGDKTEECRGSYDYWIIKTDSSGNKQWDKRFGGGNRDELCSVQQTTDGGYILGGVSYSELSGDRTESSWGAEDYWIVKTDASGNKQWDKRFGGSEYDRLYSLDQTADGGYILGGTSESVVSGDKTESSRGLSDYWIVKIDASGTKQWDKCFGGSYKDELFSLQQTTDGGYILGGYSSSGISGDRTESSQGNKDYWIIKTDINGNLKWDKRFGGSQDDGIFSLQQSIDGGYILGGESYSGLSGDKTEVSQGGADYWIVKIGNCYMSVDLGNDTAICYGKNVMLSTYEGANYIWSTGDTTFSIDVFPSANTIYSVTVSDSMCSYTDSLFVAIYSLPIVNLGEDRTIIIGNKIQLSGAGGIIYSWSPYAYLSCNICKNPIARPMQTITYELTVIDNNGCVNIDEVTINVNADSVNINRYFFVPNIFSPNGDYNNDVLYVYGKNIESIHFLIYDRLGENVFESRNINDGWDGTFRGKPMSGDVFVYYLEGKFTDGEEFNEKGNITLIR